MQGTVLQVNISPGGVPKYPVPEARLTTLGVEGDGHAHASIHGGADKAVLVICAEAIEELAARGYPVFFGALGENLTVRGLDRRRMRPGQRYRAGEVLIELTSVRAPCDTIAVYGDGIQQHIFDRGVKAGDASSPRWGLSGFYASVVRPGIVRRSDIITLVDELA